MSFLSVSWVIRTDCVCYQTIEADGTDSIERLDIEAAVEGSIPFIRSKEKAPLLAQRGFWSSFWLL